MRLLHGDAIVVGVHFADPAWEDAVAHGAQLARALDARLHLVTIVKQVHWLLRRVMDEDALAEQEAHHKQTAARRLETAREGLGDELDCSTEVRTGKPAVEILAAIAEQGAGLLVLATGKAGNHMLTSGTAERLLRLSPVPIYMAGRKAAGPIHRVLVPTGLGPSGAFAIGTACSIVEDDGQVLAYYRVTLPSVMRAYSGDVLQLRKQLEDAAQLELQAHVQTVRVPDGAPRPELILSAESEATPADMTIAAQARDRDCDLICFALGGRGLAPGMLIGRVSEKLIRSLPCALLALPDDWIAQQQLTRS